MFVVALVGSEKQAMAQIVDSNLDSRIAVLERELDAIRASQANGCTAKSHCLCMECSQVSSPPNSNWPTARLTGFFQADAGWIDQDDANRIAVGDIQDGGNFRRARLAAAGDVAENVGYMVEFDFGFPGRPSFMDVWFEVRDTLLDDVKVGLFRHPIGLDGLTSVKALTFIERSLPFAFLPFRQIGVMSSTADPERGMTLALSGFRFPTDFFGSQIGDDGGYGMATRLTKVIAEGAGDSVFHVGGAYSFIDPANDAVRYLSQPEFFIAETGGAAFVPAGVPTTVPPFADTGVIPTNTINLFAAELAGTRGSWHAQAELLYAKIDRMDASGVTFSGISAQAGYILTGEHRPYNRDSGVLGRIVPSQNFGSGGCGAWEIAARWSMLDLNDADIRGGTFNNTTFGLNWYLNKFTKFQFNYIHAFLDSPVNGDSDADLFAIRAQVDF